MRISALSLAVLSALALAGAVQGFIDVNFTPGHLVRQSQDIAVGTLAAGPQPDRWRFTLTAALKGAPPKEILLRLPDASDSAAAGITKIFQANGPQPVILFTGQDAKAGFLHAGGEWLRLTPANPDWKVDLGAKGSSGIWAGGTDMLIRLTRYLLADEKAAVPSAVGFSWLRDRALLGTVEGPFAGLHALELGNPRRPHLFVAAEKGDRLFRAKDNDEAFTDVTQAAKLDTRSKRFAWLRLAGDSECELASWDGAAIRLRQFRDGESTPVGKDFPLSGECLDLAACPTKPGGEPAILVSTADVPFLLSRQADGEWLKTPLPGAPAPESGPATCGALVLDVDHDGFLDILQPRAQGGLLWKGTPQGFAPPVASPVTCPEAPACYGVGDFDGDGFADLFLSGPHKNELWVNDGRGSFTPALSAGGSLNYKCNPGASFCCPADLNHDGRTDLCLLYPKTEFGYHFNRGFRCFGEEGQLRLTGEDGAPVTEGQVGAAAWDFNGDGALDLAVAFSDGRIACYYNDALNKPLLRVGLAPNVPGPVAFSVWQGPKEAPALGAFITSGPAVLVALREPADCTIRYTLPGRPETVRQVPWPQKTDSRKRNEVLLEP